MSSEIHSIIVNHLDPITYISLINSNKYINKIYTSEYFVYIVSKNNIQESQHLIVRNTTLSNKSKINIIKKLDLPMDKVIMVCNKKNHELVLEILKLNKESITFDSFERITYNGMTDATKYIIDNLSENDSITYNRQIIEGGIKGACRGKKTNTLGLILRPNGGHTHFLGDIYRMFEYACLYGSHKIMKEYEEEISEMEDEDRDKHIEKSMLNFNLKSIKGLIKIQINIIFYLHLITSNQFKQLVDYVNYDIKQDIMFFYELLLDDWYYMDDYYPKIYEVLINYLKVDDKYDIIDKVLSYHKIVITRLPSDRSYYSSSEY